MNILPPPRIDTPDTYTKLYPHAEERYVHAQGLTELAAEYRNVAEHSIAEHIALEEQVFGVRAAEQSEAFLEAHNNFMDSQQAILTRRLPATKADIVHKAAAYLAAGNQEKQDSWTKTLGQRLEATKDVTIVDYLLDGVVQHELDLYTRQIDLSSSDVLFTFAHSRNHEAFLKNIEQGILGHEILHGLFTSGRQTDDGGNTITIRNGLTTLQLDIELAPDDDGETQTSDDRAGKLSEWTLERWRSTLTGTPVVPYMLGVAALSTIEDFRPGTHDSLIREAVGSRGPSQAIGRLEDTLGSYGIEHLEEAIDTYTAATTVPGIIRSFGRILPLGLRTEGEARMTSHLRQQVAVLPTYIKEGAEKALVACL